jgi:hypothetical protein
MWTSGELLGDFLGGRVVTCAATDEGAGLDAIFP